MQLKTGAFTLACFLLWSHGPSIAQQADSAKKKKTTGWFNSTDLSVVITEGNSTSESTGFKNILTRKWERSEFQLHMDAVRAASADDTFLLLEPGLTILPGQERYDGDRNVVKPSKDVDVEKYFLEGKYTRKQGGRRTWNTGASWDRNEDSGILNRYIVFGGVGTTWKDGDKLKVQTGYAGSFTDREEETPDPTKEAQFFGFRGTFDVEYQVLRSTSLTYELTGNLNLEDRSDYSLDSTGAVSVTMSKRLALKVSVQFLFNSEPALEDVDVLARVETEDPDGVPGSGDELFTTVSEGGDEFQIGEGRVRKDELDTVFRTSLSITF